MDQFAVVPLRLRAQVIGARNLFGSQVGGLEPGDVRVVQALADVATIGLLQERAIHHGEVLTEQLQHALTSRVVIEQAKRVGRPGNPGCPSAVGHGQRGQRRRPTRKVRPPQVEAVPIPPW